MEGSSAQKKNKFEGSKPGLSGGAFKNQQARKSGMEAGTSMLPGLSPKQALQQEHLQVYKSAFDNIMITGDSIPQVKELETFSDEQLVGISEPSPEQAGTNVLETTVRAPELVDTVTGLPSSNNSPELSLPSKVAFPGLSRPGMNEIPESSIPDSSRPGLWLMELSSPLEESAHAERVGKSNSVSVRLSSSNTQAFPLAGNIEKKISLAACLPVSSQPEESADAELVEKSSLSAHSPSTSQTNPLDGDFEKQYGLAACLPHETDPRPATSCVQDACLGSHLTSLSGGKDASYDTNLQSVTDAGQDRGKLQTSKRDPSRKKFHLIAKNRIVGK